MIDDEITIVYGGPISTIYDTLKNSINVKNFKRMKKIAQIFGKYNRK